MIESHNNLLPPSFSLNEKGLYFEENWICSPIEVLAYTRDENNENWGRLVRFADLDGYIHEWAIPMELLGGEGVELFSQLLSLGLRFNNKKNAKNRFIEYLQSIRLDSRALCTTRIGWYKGLFILPDGPIPRSNEIYLQSENTNFAGFRIAGSLENWQKNIALPCKGNSRLIFALSCAFAAPMLPLMNAESGGFNLKGASSIGKSTALAVAASVWGGPKYLQQWKATSNALEAVAEAYNNTLLCLDELGQIDGKEAGEVIYMLANGSGKNRLKAKGGLRKKFEWNILFLSTGEISLADKVNEAGKKAQAGILNRMVDIPADAGKGYRLFDTVHHYPDGNALASHLKDCCQKYYGTAIRSFLPSLVTIKEQLPQVLQRIQEDFFAKYVPKHADGQVRRVAQRFVLMAAGGELAIKLNILPFDIGEALEAIGICFEAWLEDRGSVGAYEIEEGLRQVKFFFETHHSSRFAIMSNESNYNHDQKINNQVGYKRKTNQGGYEFFVFPEVFRKEICKGFDPRSICKELTERGILIRGNERQFIKTQQLPPGKAKIYHFTPEVLMEDKE